MNTKFIHLLYVPTMACNMQCRYCYLEDNTVDTLAGEDCVETLRYAIAKFREADVVPFNISLHGGEVTTLSKQKFHDLIQSISEYYQENRERITNAGFRVGRPHIKTNLYGWQDAAVLSVPHPHRSQALLTAASDTGHCSRDNHILPSAYVFSCGSSPY